MVKVTVEITEEAAGAIYTLLERMSVTDFERLCVSSLHEVSIYDLRQQLQGRFEWSDKQPTRFT